MMKTMKSKRIWLAIAITVMVGSFSCISSHAQGRVPPPPGGPGSDRGASVDIQSKNSNPPVYPADAFRDGVEGTVVIIVKVNEYGKFSGAFVNRSSKNHQLDQAALEAARHWQYNPAVYGGIPQSDTIRIPVDFSLKKYWEAHPDATSEQAKSFYPPGR
jgi:TonB family protein